MNKKYTINRDRRNGWTKPFERPKSWLILGIQHLKLSLLIIILINSSLIYAQEGQIEGRVVADHSGEDLSFVHVSVLDGSRETFSKEDGHFILGGLEPGEYTLVFSVIGYETLQRSINLDQSSVNLEIRMHESAYQLQEVTVQGESEEIRMAREVQKNVMPVTVLTARDIENRTGNLNELLTRQAGLQIRNSGGLGSDARISIRGLEGNRVQVFINGNPLNTPDGTFGINDLPLQVIERVEIYKGTIPAHLGGDGLGSAINVVTRHRDVSYIDATISRQSFNTTIAGLTLKKSFEKPGIGIGVGVFDNRSDNDFTMQSPYQEGLEIKRDHDYFHNFLAGASITFSRLWFDEIELETAYNSTFREQQGIQRNIQHVEAASKMNVLVLNLQKNSLLQGKLKFKGNVILGRFNTSFIDTSSHSYDWEGNENASLLGRGELGIGPNDLKTRQDELRTRLNLHYTIDQHFALNLNHTYRRANYDPRDDIGNEYAMRNLYNHPVDLENSVLGLTVEGRFLDEKLLVSTAFKHYYNQVDGFNTNINLQEDAEKVMSTVHLPGYNAGLRYNLTDHFFLKGSVEKAVRLPRNNELFGDGALITPSITLKPEEAFNYTVGAVYDRYTKDQRRIQMESNLFYMKVDNLIQLAGQGLTTGYVNYARARIMGFDMDVRADITKNIYASLNGTIQSLIDNNRFIPGSEEVPNPTYGLELPNIPKVFSNWSFEYHRDDLLWKGSNTRLIYEGNWVRSFNYGFDLSIYDEFAIPGYVAHNVIIEHQFLHERLTATLAVQNLTGANIINNWNQPLPGRSFRIKLRYLLLGKVDTHNHSE